VQSSSEQESIFLTSMYLKAIDSKTPFPPHLLNSTRGTTTLIKSIRVSFITSHY